MPGRRKLYGPRVILSEPRCKHQGRNYIESAGETWRRCLSLKRKSDDAVRVAYVPNRSLLQLTSGSAGSCSNTCSVSYVFDRCMGIRSAARIQDLISDGCRYWP